MAHTRDEWKTLLKDHEAWAKNHGKKTLPLATPRIAVDDPLTKPSTHRKKFLPKVFHFSKETVSEVDRKNHKPEEVAVVQEFPREGGVKTVYLVPVKFERPENIANTLFKMGAEKFKVEFKSMTSPRDTIWLNPSVGIGEEELKKHQSDLQTLLDEDAWCSVTTYGGKFYLIIASHNAEQLRFIRLIDAAYQKIAQEAKARQSAQIATAKPKPVAPKWLVPYSEYNASLVTAGTGIFSRASEPQPSCSRDASAVTLPRYTGHY